MAIDRGGLRYPITVEDQFSRSLNAFRARLREAGAEWQRFRSNLSTGVPTQGLRDAANATRQTARAERDLARERRRGRRELSAKEQAERRYSRAVFSSAVNREEARIAEQRQFNLDKKVLTVQQARRKAERDIAAALGRRRVVMERLRIAQQRSLDLTEKEKIQLGLASRATIKLTEEQKRLRAVRERLNAAQQRASSEELLRLEAQRRAIERITAARLAQLTTEELSRRGFDSRGTAITPTDTPAQRRGLLTFFDNLRQRVETTERSGNRISFTFRRLFGILAAFAAARFAVRIFRDMVVQTVKLNAELESATLGIASLIGSVADVRDPLGNTVDAAERLDIATAAARDQVRQLRLDALTTTATFQELVSTFQNALAPGLRAGLDVDQVRQFSRQISIAATAIGLEQRQLAEEVRSLLSATIRPQNTRIATFLGITNQDIRRAQEAGELFEFLSEQFEVFDRAGSRAALTFVGLSQRVRDGLQIIAQTGGFVFFEDLKDLLDETFQSLIQVNAITQELEPNQDLVEIVALFTEGLSAAVAEARRLRDALSIDDIRGIADGFRTLAGFLSSLLGGVIEGIVLGLRDASTLLRTIQQVVLQLTGIDILDPELLRTTVRTLVRILTIAIALGAAVAVIGTVVRGVGFLLGGFASTVRGILVTVRGIRFALTGLSTVLAGLGISTAAFAGTLLAAAAAITTILFAAREIKKVFIDGEGTFISTLGAIKVVQAQIAALEGQLGATSPLTDRLLVTGERRDRLQERIRFLKDQLAELEKEAGQRYLNLEEGANDFVDGLVDAVTGGAGKIQALLSNEIDQELEGIIARTSQGIIDLRAEFDELDKDVRRARGEAGVTRTILGLERDIAEIVRGRGNAQVEALERAKKITDEIAERELDITRLEDLTRDPQLGEEQLDRISAQIRVLDSQIEVLRRERESFERTAQLIESGRALSSLLEGNFEQQQEQALLRIEAVRARLLTQAELDRDFRRAAVLETQGDLDLIIETERQREATVARTLDALREEIRLARQRIALTREQEGEGEPETEARVAQEAALIEQLERRKRLLEEQNVLQALLFQSELKRLQVQQQINQAADQAPISTGILQAFVESFDEVADRFQTTLDIMRQAIRQFSEFIAQSIVSAFDPSSNQSIQERFARFLQQLATQIISTLIQLAVTAAVLNAASGGLLGPLLRGLATAQGFAEGGDVGEQTKKHERAQRARMRALRHRKAIGFAEGGSPSERNVRGVPRPSRGLHPRDTVNAWLDPKEWVIRASSVAAYGRDAMDRINRGLADPSQLREAAGLRGWRKSAVVTSRLSGGLVGGGEASQVDAAAEQARPAIGQTGAAAAIMMPGEEATERFLRAGQSALMRILAENGFVPNA